MAKTRMLCPGCGSADVTRDGLLRWNGEAWEMSSVLDCMQCENCGDDVSECDVIPEVKMPERTPAGLIRVRIYEEDAGGEHSLRLDGESDLTLEDFLKLNTDGIDADERGEIIEELVATGSYFGGGGAAARWQLWVVGVEGGANV